MLDDALPAMIDEVLISPAQIDATGCARRAPAPFKVDPLSGAHIRRPE
jgi:hypothetical protein